MVADEYLREENLTIFTNIFMVTPRECRKIDINVGVGVVSISHLAHTHIQRAVGDHRLVSCIGLMPMYLIWSKHFVVVWISPAFLLSFFIFQFVRAYTEWQFASLTFLRIFASVFSFTQSSCFILTSPPPPTLPYS